MKTKNIIACLILLIATQAITAQNNANALVSNIVDQIKDHNNVELVFSYQISPDGKKIGDSNKGHAWLQGEAYRIEMAERQTVSDGKTIWSYLIDDEEVIVSNADEGAENTPTKLIASLDDNYAATLVSIDAKGNATIELANPKGQYKRVTLKLNTNKKTELKSADFYLEDGSKVMVTVDEMKYDQHLDDTFFFFDTNKHPNVDVIDMR